MQFKALVKFILNNPIKIFLGLLMAVILFHICIAVKVIPYDLTWGGRLQNDNEMYVFEIISILLNLFLGSLLLIKGNFVKHKFSEKIINAILWVFFAIFIVNTIRNIIAINTFEKLFSILTAISASLLWLILKQKKTANHE